MASAASEGVRKDLITLFRGGATGGLSDGQLLERFVGGDGETAAAAFTALVERHGPMVLRVCRAELGDPHAAEDASQAAFLVLARRAGSIRRRESVASWLFGVARKVAVRARRDAARRRLHERRGAEMAAQRADAGMRAGEARLEVFEELDRLPERLRAPIVLCDLEDYTQEQAARQLQWPLRTFQRRLTQGRERLRGRLARRGVVASAAGLTAALAPPAMSAEWVDATVRAAISRTAAAGAVPAAVIKLSDEVLKAMFLGKVKISAALVLAAAGAVASGAGMLARRPATPDAPHSAPLVALNGPVDGPQDAPRPTAPASTPPPTTPAATEAIPAGPRVVEGRVLDAQGKPVRVDFAWVLAHGRRTTSPSYTIPGAPIPLDDRGNFRVELPLEEWTTGPLDVTIVQPDCAPIVKELPAGRGTSRVEVKLEPGPWKTTEVVVTDVDGKPVAGADYAVLVESKPFASLKTDAEGRCRVRMAINYLSGFRITAPGFRPLEQYRQNASQEPEVAGIRLRHSLRGIVRDASGKPLAKALIGGEIRPMQGSWKLIGPPGAIRETKVPVRDARGQVVPAGALGRYFERMVPKLGWQPIHPDDIRRYEGKIMVGGTREMTPEEYAKEYTPYEVRLTRGGWWMSALPMMQEPVRTDAEGRFAFDPPSYDNQRLVFASRDFAQLAVHTMHDDDPDEPLEITLRPARLVQAPVVEEPADDPKAFLGWTVFTVTPGGKGGETWAEGFLPDLNAGDPPHVRRKLRVHLPAASYRIDFRSETTHRIVDLKVPEGEGPLDLPEIVLARSASARMAGRTAAEIEATDLEGRPVKLADYKGKVIVLDFWGAWCGPCVASMPKLVALQEKYKGQPLAILALHDASATNAKEYERAIAQARAQLWGGRDLAFPVLLDRRPKPKPGELDRPGPGEPGSGLTNEAYEVSQWPSTFVIDRNGRMVGKFGIDALEAAVRTQLGLPDLAASSPRPAPPAARPAAPRSKGPVVYRGRVLGPSGTPVRDAKVTPDMSPVKEPEVKTAADGTFALTLTDGTAQLGYRVEAPGLATRSVPLSAVDLLPRSVTLDVGATFSGRVVQGGKPAAGVVVGLSHADRMGGKFLGHWEARTDDQGRFRFPHAPAAQPYDFFGVMASLKGRGAIPPRKVRTGAIGSSTDIGDVEIEPAHSLAGRIAFTDGITVPKGTILQVGIEDAWDLQELPVGADGRFEVRGLPTSKVTVAAVFPNRFFAPDGYCLSPKNKNLEPLNPYRLMGRIDRDITGLVLLFEPGETPPPNLDQGVLADFKETQERPLKGAEAADLK